MNFTEQLKKMADLVRVVPGEAAESDSEEEINTNAIAAASRLMTAPAKGVIVQGEASETESEEDDDDAAETSSSGATHHKSVVESFATQRQSSITPLKGMLVLVYLTETFGERGDGPGKPTCTVVH